MKELELHIISAEKEWLNKIYTFCASLYENKKIPSHNHTHHLRVWEYSKEILKVLEANYTIDYDLVEACLISSLFHDTGLTQNLGENHGFESKKICMEYFENHKDHKPKYFREILEAIEKHDDKNYTQKNLSPNSILSILCNADDLDAFGKIGIIRYTEIYLLRGISIEELPNLVIQNLDKRFFNFEKTYKQFPELYTKHKSRYLNTRNFFEDLKKEFI